MSERHAVERAPDAVRPKAQRGGGSKRSAANTVRAQRAVDLRIAGATWPQIAAELGYETEAGPRELVNRYFESVAVEQKTALTGLLIERGEALWRKAWSRLNQAQAEGATPADFARLHQQALNAGVYLARVGGVTDRQIEITAPPDNVRRLRDEFLALRAAPTPPDHNTSTKENAE